MTREEMIRYAATNVEPPPSSGSGVPVIPRFIESRQLHHDDPLRIALEARFEFGIDKYGTPLKTNNGRNALVDSLQEALDMIAYLSCARAESKHIQLADALQVCLDRTESSARILLELLHGGLMPDAQHSGRVLACHEPRLAGNLANRIQSVENRLDVIERNGHAWNK